MVKTWQKIKCGCGKDYFETVKEHYKGFPYELEKCPKCKHKVFTMDQAEEYQKILELVNSTKESRKIIKVGNSLGLTLPTEIKKFGVKQGQNATLKFINDHSLQIEFAK